MSSAKDREEVAKELVALAADHKKLARLIANGDLPLTLTLVATLVMRPSCRMVDCTIDRGQVSWGMCCSACGEEFGVEVRRKPDWRYCPMCGAEIEGEDADE